MNNATSLYPDRNPCTVPALLQADSPKELVHVTLVGLPAATEIHKTGLESVC